LRLRHNAFNPVSSFRVLRNLTPLSPIRFAIPWVEDLEQMEAAFATGYANLE
jgi:hypothetical protein